MASSYQGPRCISLIEGAKTFWGTKHAKNKEKPPPGYAVPVIMWCFCVRSHVKCFILIEFFFQRKLQKQILRLPSLSCSSTCSESPMYPQLSVLFVEMTKSLSISVDFYRTH